MRKGWFLVGVTLLLMPVILSGCGVAQEQYDSVVADLSNVQQELQAVNAELEAAQTGVSKLTASLDKTTTELNTTTTELETTQAELEISTAENSELQENFDNSQVELSEAQDTITGLREDVSGLRSEISTLEARIPILVYETYVNEDVGFSIDYPKNWDKPLELFLEGQGMVTFMDTDTGANVIVACEQLPEPMSAQEYFNAVVEQISDTEITILGEMEITVSGITAIRCVNFVEDDDAMQVMCTLVTGETAWTVVTSALAENFTDYTHTFNEVIDSFKILGTGPLS
jgi:predicted RNase H-like nuclease (RuvC/YqgF family)